MAYSSPQYTGNPHTQTNINIGAVTTASPPNIVCNTLHAQGPDCLLRPGQEQQHIRTALSRCNYPSRVFLRLQTKLDFHLSLQDCNTNHSINRNKDNKTPLWWSLTQNVLSESFKRICNKVGVQLHFKVGNTIKDLLMAPKEKDNITKKGGVIYKYKCEHSGCTMEYTEETGRTFGDRYKEHLRVPSPIYDHANTMDYSIKLDNFSIVDRESQGVTNTIKEAMFIRVNDPPLKRNLVKYQKPQIWDEVLQDMPAPHLPSPCHTWVPSPGAQNTSYWQVWSSKGCLLPKCPLFIMAPTFAP